jgi:hypothetical protein
MLDMNRFATEVFFGIMLSDGSLSHRQVNTTFIFGLKAANVIYVWSVFLLFSHLCSSYPHIDCSYDREYDTVKYKAVFQTMALPCFNYWFDLFYIVTATGKTKI